MHNSIAKKSSLGQKTSVGAESGRMETGTFQVLLPLSQAKVQKQNTLVYRFIKISMDSKILPEQKVMNYLFHV